MFPFHNVLYQSIPRDEMAFAGTKIKKTKKKKKNKERKKMKMICGTYVPIL